MKASLQPQQTRPAAVTPLPARSGLLQRKCACGGTPGFDGECAACRQKRLLGGTFQAKLRINQPGDPFEREADRVAEQVMRMPAPGLPHRSKKGGEEDVFQTRSVVQRRVGGDVGTQAEVPPVVHDVLRSPGRPLDPATRAFFEPRFGHDFSAVRIHTDARAAESARAVDALAYTVGRDVVFGAGQYAPGTGEGRRLLAHELTHVVQQRAFSASAIKAAHILSDIPLEALEAEAETASTNFITETLLASGQVRALSIQRQETPRPRPAPVDENAQRIIDLAQDSSRTIEERAVAVVQAIIRQYFPSDSEKISRIIYRAEEPGLHITYTGRGARTTGIIEVGRYFVENTTQRHFARRVLQVRHEIQHVEQQRAGMIGESRQDEREFLAFSDEALATELPGTGRLQHSTRVLLIDAALGYYHCLSDDLQRSYASRRDSLLARRTEAVRGSGRSDLGEAPTTCRRQAH